KQLGLHGDDGPGLEPQGVVGSVAAGSAGALAATASRGAAMGAGSGIQDVRAGVHAAAVSDRAHRPEAGVPLVVVESVPADLLAVGVRTPLLTPEILKSGSGCPDPPRPRVQSYRKSGETYKEYKRATSSPRPGREPQIVRRHTNDPASLPAAGASLI